MAEESADGLTWTEGSQWVVDQGSERHLVERVAVELERRGWSGSELARRMDAAGHPMSQPVVSRLLKSGEQSRPKAVTVDQLIGLAKVLEIPFGELLLPPGLLERAEAWRLLKVAAELRARIAKDEYDLEALTRQLAKLASESAEFRADLSNTIAGFRKRDEEFMLKVWENDVATAEQLGVKPPARPGLGDWVPSPWEQVCTSILERGKSDG